MKYSLQLKTWLKVVVSKSFGGINEGAPTDRYTRISLTVYSMQVQLLHKFAEEQSSNALATAIDKMQFEGLSVDSKLLARSVKLYTFEKNPQLQ